MKNIDYIIGDSNTLNTPLVAFDDEVCEFLSQLSKEILKSEFSKKFSDLATFAFYIRKANIAKIKADYSKNLLGRGLCFHIAPSNVPLNFAFSYVFSLLAGNANIVRLPSKHFEQIDIFCDIMCEILPKFQKIQNRTAFVKYNINDEITEFFSKIADARMIWGGDKSITHIKSFETMPRCVDITFANRYSFAIIDARAILGLSDDELHALANDFYNDTYLMDQNACSSPKLILWLNDDKAARQKFWQAVVKAVKNKYNFADIMGANKYAFLCEQAILNDDIKGFLYDENLLYRLEIDKIDESIFSANCGIFYEKTIKNYDIMLDFLNEKFQTICYFGKIRDEICEFLYSHHARGIDRIVKIGKALEISHLWDGHDIIRELSREIN